MKKLYEEICLLEASNIILFDLELNYKCNVFERNIIKFLYKIEELPLVEKIKENKENVENKENNENCSQINEINEIKKEEEIKPNNNSKI